MGHPRLIAARKSHPASHWQREIEYRGWSLTEFSERSGIPLKRLHQPLPIDREFAEGCARAFGTSIEFWLNLQSQYDEWLIERQ